MNRQRFGLFAAAALVGALVLTANVSGAELSKDDLRRISAKGPVTIELVYMTPLEEEASEALTFEVRMNTHSVDLEQFDIASLSRLETSDGLSIEPLGWFKPGGGGHHRYGLLKFSAKRPEGSPVIQPGTSFIEAVVRDVGGVAERRFRWEFPLTKKE